MKLFTIVKSGCFYTAPHTVRLNKVLLSPLLNSSRFIHNSLTQMRPHNFYGTPVKVLKSSQPHSPSKIDAQDLLALEESFSNDESSSMIITDVKRVMTQSPAKVHNRQFENDFDIDLSEEDSSEGGGFLGLRPGKENIEPTTKLGSIVKNFESSPATQKFGQKIKISQLRQSSEKPQPQKKEKIVFEEDFEDSLKETSFPKKNKIAFEENFEDSPEEKPTTKGIKIVFEEDFEDSFDEELESRTAEPVQKQTKLEKVGRHTQAKDISLTQAPDAVSGVTSSSVFTSSPSYHKYETLNRRVPEPRIAHAPETGIKTETTTGNRQPVLFRDFDDDFQNDPFPELSNEVARNGLYPELPLIQSTQKDFAASIYPSMDSYEERYGSEFPAQMEFQNLKRPSSVLFDGMRFKEPSVKREAPKSIPNLLNRPKKRNAEILLLTQRPPLHAMNQVRHSSTSTKPERSTESDPRAKKVQTFALSEEQQHVVDLAKKGISLFYTGSAGTGKSVLLRSMIKTLRAQHSSSSVAVTASTGLAACNIGGITLHSFAGIGLGKDSALDIIKKVRKSRKSTERWKTVKVLVIDEISMIDGALFDKLDTIAKVLRKNDSPFGGIQLIVCGDFFQLPPVSRKDEEPATFCFDSKAWKQCIKLTITLEQVFRQKGDMEFITMLNEMRVGRLSTNTIERFLELQRELPPDEIEPAELYCTRYEVDGANSTRLRTLNTQVRTFVAQDHSTIKDQQQRERMLANFMAPRVLKLKKGAQVMMIKNIDENLVNGSLGKVIDFLDTATFQTYERIMENNQLDDSEIELAIEKSKEESKKLPEGNHEQAVDKLEDSIFDFLTDLQTQDPEARRNIEMKKDLMNKLNESSSGRRLPLVKFLTVDGSSRTVLVQPEKWEVEDEHETPLVTRVQLPLILAWALSIHKSQGQTLPRVRVNLKRVFEKGQAYVALSRAISREGLQVLHFDSSKVLAHDRVLEFYGQLKSALDAKKAFEGGDKPIQLGQRDIRNAKAVPVVECLDDDSEDQFVDASSPSEFERKRAVIATQDDSSDNIVVSKRNFYRNREYA